MAAQVISKINGRLKFLYRKNRFLTPELRRLLCNALIQPHFDYASSAWYINLNKGYKDSLDIIQRKCIRFCLMRHSRFHIGYDEFAAINWLPVSRRADQVICSLIYKFFNGESPTYMNHVFSPVNGRGSATRRSFQKLAVPSRTKVPGKRSLSFVGPTLWNEIPVEYVKNGDKFEIKTMKACGTVNDFKHELKSHYLGLLNAADKNVYLYYK